MGTAQSDVSDKKKQKQKKTKTKKTTHTKKTARVTTASVKRNKDVSEENAPHATGEEQANRVSRRSLKISPYS